MSVEQLVRSNIGRISTSKLAVKASGPLDKWIAKVGKGLVVTELQLIEHDSYPSRCREAIDAEAGWIVRFLAEGHELFNINQRKKAPYRIVRLADTDKFVPIEQALDAVEREKGL